MQPTLNWWLCVSASAVLCERVLMSEHGTMCRVIFVCVPLLLLLLFLLPVVLLVVVLLLVAPPAFAAAR